MYTYYYYNMYTKWDVYRDAIRINICMPLWYDANKGCIFREIQKNVNIIIIPLRRRHPLP